MARPLTCSASRRTAAISLSSNTASRTVLADVYSTIVADRGGGRPAGQGHPRYGDHGSNDPVYGKDPRKAAPCRPREGGRATPLRCSSRSNISQPRPAGGLDIRKSRARHARFRTGEGRAKGGGRDRCRCPRTASVRMRGWCCANSTSRCRAARTWSRSGHPNGFGLTLERKSRPTIHLSRDQTIPESRGCPDRYGIAEVHALALPDGSTALAAVIQYFYSAS